MVKVLTKRSDEDRFSCSEMLSLRVKRSGGHRSNSKKIPHVCIYRDKKNHDLLIPSFFGFAPYQEKDHDTIGQHNRFTNTKKH